MVGTCMASTVIDVVADLEIVSFAISGALWGIGSDGAVVVVDILRVDRGDELAPAKLYIPNNGWHFPVVDVRKCNPIGREWVTIPRKSPVEGCVMLGMERVADVSMEIKRAEHRLVLAVHCVGANNNTNVQLNVIGTVYYNR